ncbi:MAG: hypothetical protein Q4G70_01135 [Pseudomonadota bacterium]|nr:hypothetical protein [Pseudomonadota bacterium]
MQFIQRFLSAGDLRRTRAASLHIMRHVRLEGRAECVATRDSEGRQGVLLVVQTSQHIPFESREEIQHYFRRKLTELGELRDRTFRLLIQDAGELSLSVRARSDSSSARIAAVIAAANFVASGHAPDIQLEGMRQRMTERRQTREDSDFAPLTDIGALAD